MDIFEHISNTLTLFLYDKNLINEDEAEVFDFYFGRTFFFIITFSCYMLLCMNFTTATKSFYTIMCFNLAYNIVNYKIQFHALRMQNCAVMSGIFIMITLFLSALINRYIVFKFSYITWCLIISFIISYIITTTKGMRAFRWIERNILATK